MYLTLDDLTPFLLYNESKNSKPLKRYQNKRIKKPERVQKRKLFHSTCPSININKIKNNSTKPNNSNPELQPTKIENCLWPKADIIEYSPYYQIELELPGFKKQDISIDYDNEENELIIKGAYIYRPKKSEHIVTVEDDLEEDSSSSSSSDLTSVSGTSTGSEGTELLMERKSKKDFNRSFKIEKKIIEKEIKAELVDGVLSLILPKSTTKKNKKIRIDIQ